MRSPERATADRAGAPPVAPPAAAPAAASRNWRDRLRPPRRLKVTREGWYYCLLAIGVGIAALNTGNNLLFLVLGLQLTAIVVSGVLSETTLRRLSLERLPASDPAAGEPFLFGYRVHNGNRLFPSFSLMVYEKGSGLDAARATLLQVGPRRSEQGAATLTAPRRGRYALEWVAIATRFPFGLFEKSTELRVPGELWVTPRRVPAPTVRARGGTREGDAPENRAGRGSEFLGLRELRPGDDRRLVHWRKSAAVGRLLAIEREREKRRRVVLLLDDRGPPGDEGLERSIERAAALARRLSGRGLAVGLATSRSWLPPESGPTALRRLLRELATLEPAPATGATPDARGEAALWVPRREARDAPDPASAEAAGAPDGLRKGPIRAPARRGESHREPARDEVEALAGPELRGAAPRGSVDGAATAAGLTGEGPGEAAAAETREQRSRTAGKAAGR